MNAEPFHLQVPSLNRAQAERDLVVTLRWVFSGLSEVSWWSQSSSWQAAPTSQQPRPQSVPMISRAGSAGSEGKDGISECCAAVRGGPCCSWSPAAAGFGAVGLVGCVFLLSGVMAVASAELGLVLLGLCRLSVPRFKGTSRHGHFLHTL